MRISAALLVGLLSPAAAILSVADEKTVLTGFDLGEFMSGLMHGATGEESENFQECTKLALSLKDLQASVTKLQSFSTIMEGFNGLFTVLEAAGNQFKGCKSGFQSTVKVAKAMFDRKPGTFMANVQAIAQPVAHYSEIVKLAGSVTKALKEGSYREAGDSLGQILNIAGLVSTPVEEEMDPGEPPASHPKVRRPAKSKSLFGLFKPPTRSHEGKSKGLLGLLR